MNYSFTNFNILNLIKKNKKKSFYKKIYPVVFQLFKRTNRSICIQ